MSPIRVGIIGAGPVGTKLGARLRTSPAFTVKYGSRNPAGKAVEGQPDAVLDTVPAVVEWSDVCLLTTPGAHTVEGNKELATSLGPHIKGKVLIDATNPLTPWPGLEVMWGTGTSATEVFAEALPGTHVFKAFNTIGEVQFLHADGSQITGQQLTMLYAGGPERKDIVEQVIEAVGFKPEYVGGVRYARNLEALAELWIHMAVPAPVGPTAVKTDGNFHFQVLKKP